MVVHKMKLAFCAIVRPADDEADVLKRLLENVSPHVDKMFITITGKNKRCEEVAELYGAEVSHYEWDYNFAKARNFNFKQVPKEYEYILWGDADDVFRGLEKLKPTIKKFKDVDTFLMNYLYWFDANNNPTIVHMKTQVIRNDGCVEWEGELHEDFKMNRELDSYFIKGIDRLHLSDESRASRAQERNHEIAQKGLKARPDDPRSWWNMAAALKAVDQNEQAIIAYERFIRMSESDDEKFIAYLHMSEVHLNTKDFSKALDNVNMAIGMKTEYPDGHHLKGAIYLSMGRFHESLESYKKGLVLKPPYFKIIVYNPRDYDYNPMKAAARAAVGMEMPQLAIPLLEGCLKIVPDDKELKGIVKVLKVEEKRVDKIVQLAQRLGKIKDDDKLERELAKVPEEFRAHPMLSVLRNTRIIKKKSSGKDLVIYCGETHEKWTPDTVKKSGIGGSEEAVIHIAKGLVKRGWNVEVYNKCGHKQQTFDGVVYKPYWLWNYRDKQDVVILWRHARPLDFTVNADKVYVDFHDVMPEGEVINRLDKIEKIFVKSHAQRELFPNVPSEKFEIIPNGVDVEPFKQKVKRDPYLLVNFSSADRSLETILDILPEIKKRLPKKIADKVRFEWYYGWGVFDKEYTSARAQGWKQSLLKKFDQFKKEGWAAGGTRINHDEVARKNLEAGALIYPTGFFEIDYIGGTKAQLAGCVPITTDFAALREKIRFGTKVPTTLTNETWSDIPGNSFGIRDKVTREKFINAVVSYLSDVEKWDNVREEMKEWAQDNYNWEFIIDKWDKELCATQKQKIPPKSQFAI